MWIRAMVVAFVLNGICPFGLRILAGMGVGKEYTPVYLFYWYLGGVILGLVWVIRERKPLSRSAMLIGSAMAVASVGGQVSMGLAMAYGAPGTMVFMIAQGASICIVVAGGALFFEERVGNYGKAGIAVGLLATVLLGVWG